jgi:hypothetical protein
VDVRRDTMSCSGSRRVSIARNVQRAHRGNEDGSDRENCCSQCKCREVPRCACKLRKSTKPCCDHSSECFVCCRYCNPDDKISEKSSRSAVQSLSCMPVFLSSNETKRYGLMNDGDSYDYWKRETFEARYRRRALQRSEKKRQLLKEKATRRQGASHIKPPPPSSAAKAPSCSLKFSNTSSSFCCTCRLCSQIVNSSNCSECMRLLSDLSAATMPMNVCASSIARSRTSVDHELEQLRTGRSRDMFVPITLEPCSETRAANAPVSAVRRANLNSASVPNGETKAQNSSASVRRDRFLKGATS